MPAKFLKTISNQKNKMKTILLLFLLPFSVCFGQTKKPVPKTKPTAKPATVMSSTDSLSYSIGVQVAEYYKTMGAEKLSTNYEQLRTKYFSNSSIIFKLPIKKGVRSCNCAGTLSRILCIPSVALPPATSIM